MKYMKRPVLAMSTMLDHPDGHQDGLGMKTFLVRLGPALNLLFTNIACGCVIKSSGCSFSC